MRSSSIKSFAAATSIVIALTAAVPVAGAATRDAQTGRVVTRQVVRERVTIQNNLLQLMTRLAEKVKGVVANATPTIPIPSDD